jgi:hypothetical protein
VNFSGTKITGYFFSSQKRLHHKNECVFFNEAIDFDSKKNPKYTSEEEDRNAEEYKKTSSIRGKYTVLNHLCFKIGYNCHTRAGMAQFV